MDYSIHEIMFVVLFMNIYIIFFKFNGISLYLNHEILKYKLVFINR